MATTRPAIVVSNAADTPGASVAMLAVCCTETALNASITPHTVPSNPRNGAPETIVARKIMLAS